MYYGHRCVNLDLAQTGGQAVFFGGRTLGWPRAKIGALFFFGSSLCAIYHGKGVKGWEFFSGTRHYFKFSRIPYRQIF
jgi:hypothetical protein